MIHNISRFIAALALLATAQGAWAWDGSGTAESPYQIKLTADLDQLATDVNGGTEHEGDYFVLTTDLTYSHETDWNDASSTENNYTPIGGQYDQQWRYFNGHFDGQGHTISGIRIYKSGDTTAEQCMGLFGRIKDGADVKNVFLADARITANDYCGPIVGYNRNGRVENCHVLSDVTVHVVTASADYNGGVVGYNAGTITGCTSAASITAAVSCKYNGGITGSGTGSGTVEDCIYFGSTVAGDKYVGAIIGYAASGSTVSNCYYTDATFTGKNSSGTALTNDASAIGYKISDATIDDVRLATSDDFAVSGDTYTIGSTAGWSVMCAALYHNDTFNRFSGKTVQLGADITVTRMAGGSNHAFTGTFDGGDHTLTLAYGTADAPIDAQFVAPFVETANDGEHQPTFRNLTIAGTIYDGYTGSEAHNVGGLIGHLFGNVTIEHCTSLVEIHAKVGAGGFVGLCEHDVSFNDCHSAAVIRSADGSNSGFVAWSRASAHTIAFTGCLFDGKLLQQNGSGSLNGGFIGWTGETKTVTITNSLCAPAPLAAGETMASSGSATFARGWNATTTATNSFDTAAFEIAQGKATRTVTAGTDVTIEAIALTGTATQYTVSGITAYSGGGLQRGQTLYYGSDDQLSLTLTTSAQCDQAGYQYAYTASAGTLSGTTLTMPDQDVTISVNTATLAPIDWATVNQGTDADPYMIYNKDQLLLLAHRVNGTNGETANDYSRKYFKLGADIKFDHPIAEPDDYAENYEAIGGRAGGTMRYFSGNFDGDGRTVSGIRINKTGSGIADNYQGLFGYTGGSAYHIHDVHLTDARITGYDHVGGIIAYNTGIGYVSGCTVTDSYITATHNRYYGTICGRNDGGTLTNNYYHGCTVNSTPVTSGMGCHEADITANNGALPAYAITLGANVTTPPGTFAGQTGWLDTPPVDARLAPENGFTLAGNHYFASGYEFTPGSTLASGAAQGYTPRAILDGQLLDLYTPTGDAPDYTGTAIARLTITADCDGKTLKAAIRSDGQQHDVSYMTADGSAQTAQAIALDGTEKNLAAGWYFVGQPTVAFDHTLNLGGDVNLILVDGNTMKVRTTKTRDGISAEGHSLHIYGQTEGTGVLNAQTNGKAVVIRITNGTLGIHGGNVNANEESTVNTESAIRVERATAGDALVIDRGTLTANSNSSCGIYIEGGDARINGGQVTATGAQLGIDISDYEDDDDEPISIPGILTLSGGTLTASSFDTWSGESFAGTLAIAPGLTYTDGTSLYDSTTETATLAALGGKTLQPCLALNEADGVTPLTALAGQTNVPVIFTRTFSANVASTICLPFAVSAEQATAAGKFYSFAGVETSGSDWVVTMQETAPSNLVSGELAANTPYLFIPSASSEVTFSGTIGTVADTYTAGTTTSGDWTYRGTYTTIEWPSDPGNIYGFASGQAYGNSGDQTEAGKFIRVHTGGIRPFRAYLEYNRSAGARAMSGSASSHELPETMTVRLIGADGQTSAIGTLDTRTGEATFDGDAWYTLDGRRLSGKPAAKGLYIKNGKKTVIK